MLLNGFQSSPVLWNPLSKAVSGKFHGPGEPSKCNCLPIVTGLGRYKLSLSLTLYTMTMTFFSIWLFVSFQARLRILERETRMLTAFSKECLDLEQAYVTRHGGECGVSTNKRELNYFCRETRSSMANLTNAFTEFHAKLSKWVSHCCDTVMTAST